MTKVYREPGYHVTISEGKQNQWFGPCTKTVTATVTTKSGTKRFQCTSENWGENYRQVYSQVNGVVWRDAGKDLKLK